MAILDFKEIPPSNSSSGEQDTFELFARDFFEALGCKIEEGPSRGADGGRDLLILDAPQSPAEVPKRWLVSCKHYAHSGRSAGVDDEVNIRDRIEQFGAQGFLGFYSTLPSSGLENKLIGLRANQNMEFQVFDWAKIEQLLLGEPKLRNVALRYFPQSYKKKLEQEIRNELELALMRIKDEFAGKAAEATRKNDAVTFLKIQREHERQETLMKHQCELRISQLGKI